LRRPLSFVACGVLMLALAPGSASGHSELLASSPRDGDRLAEAPPAVVLRFSEPLRRPILVRVRDARGREKVQAVRFTARKPRIVRAPLSALAPGRYRVQWIVIAADGFTQGGGFAFRLTP
jgi:methionine-rich copper-binding protein CopC